MLRYILLLVAFVIALPAYSQDSCEYANDNECDEAQYGGQGYCDIGTDTTDCSLLSAGIANDSCEFANDGACGESRYGVEGVCQDGSDTSDCAMWQGQRESDFMDRARAMGFPAVTVANLGNNTCRWSNDGECDDSEFGGSGYCVAGTDATDCLALAAQDASTPAPTTSGDSCVFANDNECDEVRYGGIGACEIGTDTTDCRANATTAADGSNSCEYSNDGECDETRFGGGGYCDAGTDTADCRQLATGIDDNSCVYANDNECDEVRYGGGGECLAGTDRTDCELYGTQADVLQRLIDLIPNNIEAVLGDDSCEYANNGECDDANFGGQPFCDAGTDATDCRLWAAGDDSCEYANDGDCDEPSIGRGPSFGLGFCDTGTDATDCTESVVLRNRTDECNTAFDGICNEPFLGDGTCDFGIDTSDCLGRGRPRDHPNHYFGRDDRILVDTTEMPWAAIGALQTEGGFGYCTGTLVAPNLVLTAAHCLYDNDGTFVLPHQFAAGSSYGVNNGTARVLRGFHGEGYDYFAPNEPLGGGNGHDWGIIVLGSELGNDVGIVPVRELAAKDLSQIGRSGLVVSQAGYSWDTGDNLSGHMGCRVTDAFEDNSFLHVCDTARGDSGSPFLLQIDGQWHVIGVDSQFFEDEDTKGTFARQANLGVDSRAFAAAVAEN